MIEDILKGLQDLQVESQVDVDTDPDMSLFKKEKKKKKNKLYSEIDNILDDESDTGNEDMFIAMGFKSKKKDKEDVDGDIFDTDGKKDKKLKNIEAKFKPELANLAKLLKENEALAKSIKTILDPIFTSKARIPYKTLVDLITAYNVTNSNKMQNIKETANLKKSIWDLKLKMEAKDKSSNELQMDEYGSQLFDQLFKTGRKNVIDNISEYNPAMDTPVNMGNYSTSIDDAINARLNTETNEDGSSFRTEEGSKYIQYEHLQPELYIQKSFETGDLDVVAVGNDGVVIDDYPVPSIEQLGKITFNEEAGTCTDQTGRVFKVMEVK